MCVYVCVCILCANVNLKCMRRVNSLCHARAKIYFYQQHNNYTAITTPITAIKETNIQTSLLQLCDITTIRSKLIASNAMTVFECVDKKKLSKPQMCTFDFHKSRMKSSVEFVRITNKVFFIVFLYKYLLFLF